MDYQYALMKGTDPLCDGIQLFIQSQVVSSSTLVIVWDLSTSTAKLPLSGTWVWPLTLLAKPFHIDLTHKS